MYNYSLENKYNTNLYLLELNVNNDNKFVKFIENKMDTINFKTKNIKIDNIIVKLIDIKNIKEYIENYNINNDNIKIINKKFCLKINVNKNNLQVFYFIN